MVENLSSTAKSSFNQQHGEPIPFSSRSSALFHHKSHQSTTSRQFNVFISAPWNRVVAIRFPHFSSDQQFDFGASSVGRDLRAKIELLLGIHASSYDLYVGTRKLSISGDCFVTKELNSAAAALKAEDNGGCDAKYLFNPHKVMDDELGRAYDVRDSVVVMMPEDEDLSSATNFTDFFQGDVVSNIWRDGKCNDSNRDEATNCENYSNKDEATNRENDSNQDEATNRENEFNKDEATNRENFSNQDEATDREKQVFPETSEILRSGTLLKVVPRAGWEDVFEVGRGWIQGSDLDLFVDEMKKAMFGMVGTPENAENLKSKGTAALFLAAHQGRAAIVCKLLQTLFENSDMAFDSELLTPYGRSPLHAACAGDHSDLVSLLIRQFALSPLQKDAFEQSPLSVAVACRSSLAKLEIQRFLRDNPRKLTPGKSTKAKNDGGMLQDNRVESSEGMHVCGEFFELTGAQSNENFDLLEGSKSLIIFAEQSLAELDIHSQETIETRSCRSKNLQRTFPSAIAYYKPNTIYSRPEIFQRIASEAQSANNITDKGPNSSSSESAVIHHRRTCSRHSSCATGRPFVATRRVDPEEEGVTVQFIPLGRPSETKCARQEKQHCSAAGCRQVKSATTESVGRSLAGRRLDCDDELTIYSEVSPRSATSQQRFKGCSSCSREMASGRYSNGGERRGGAPVNYYRTKFHRALSAKEKAEDMPIAIPAMARKSYRPWKTWLTELYAQRGATSSASQSRDDAAFRHWLRESRRRGWGGARERREEQEEEQSIDERRKEIKAVLNPMAFEKWLDKKSKNPTPSQISTHSAAATPRHASKIAANPQNYLRCHSAWAAGTTSERRGRLRELAPTLASGELDALRRELILGGVTYDEWMQLKELEAARDAAANEGRMEAAAKAQQQ